VLLIGVNMTKHDVQLIRQFVLENYLNTEKPIFVSDLMAKFETNAKGIHNALGYDDFIFEHDSKWQGSNYSGKFVLSPCVEPSKSFLVKTIKSLKVAV
jgi:hypothetical protein